MARQQLLWSDLHGMDFAELAQVRPPDPAGRLFRRHGSGPACAVLVADGPARLLSGADAERLDRDRFALDSLHRLWSARAKTVGGQTMGVRVVLTAVCALDTVLALLLAGPADRGALLVVGVVCGLVGLVGVAVIALGSRAVSAYTHGIALTAALAAGPPAQRADRPGPLGNTAHAAPQQSGRFGWRHRRPSLSRPHASSARARARRACT